MKGYTIKSFSVLDSRDYTGKLSEKIKNEIEAKGKEYILGIDEDEFKKYLITNYTITLLNIDYQNELIEKPILKKVMVPTPYNDGSRYEKEFYNFTIRYSFTGSPTIFKIRPRHYFMTSGDIYIDDVLQTVSFSFDIYNQDAKEFNRIKSEMITKIFSNLDGANKEASTWNTNLPRLVNSHFNLIKSKFEAENNFFAAINLKLNNETPTVFSAPTVIKKIIPQPKVSKNKEFSSEPIMSTEIYDDILKVIYDSGKNMEKKPALYKGKDEEGLRDQFLFVLESRYDGTTATGETFNRGGKTDIILKFAKDASNLFVAECKFWHGSSEFLKAINQLFDRYLTWRDSKAALILFVTNNDFSSVLQTIKADIKTHPYFTKEIGYRGETSFSYIFCLPQDKDKAVFFEVLVFHYDKCDKN